MRYHADSPTPVNFIFHEYFLSHQPYGLQFKSAHKLFPHYTFSSFISQRTPVTLNNAPAFSSSLRKMSSSNNSHLQNSTVFLFSFLLTKLRGRVICSGDGTRTFWKVFRFTGTPRTLEDPLGFVIVSSGLCRSVLLSQRRMRRENL